MQGHAMKKLEIQEEFKSHSKATLSKIERIIAVVLATFWLVVGVAGIVIGFSSGRWLLALVALGSQWMTVLWVRAAYLGRRLEPREFLWPFRKI